VSVFGTKNATEIAWREMVSIFVRQFFWRMEFTNQWQELVEFEKKNTTVKSSLYFEDRLSDFLWEFAFFPMV